LAEIMLLLIFCLLIALAAYLRFEKGKLSEAEAVIERQAISQADRNLIGAVKQSPALYEKLREASESPDGRAIDEFWRDLVANEATSSQLRQMGLSTEQLREKVKAADAVRAKGVDTETALRDIDIVGSLQSVMPTGGAPIDPQTVKETLQRGLGAKEAAGHQWPPIIDLSEANGHYFQVGSAALSPDFRTDLMTTVPQRIADLMRQYDVDMIEVVGHTDEQRIENRPTNLDQGLIPVLRNGAAIESLVPADNAGLGLARAVSVVSVLRQSELLQGYKLVPLSGAQLVNTDDTLALAGTRGDIRERRRIEIRLRKSSPHDTQAHEASADVPEVPLPRPRPVIPRRPRARLLSPTRFPSSPFLPTQP
jgi:flagellar motor protein MotB